MTTDDLIRQIDDFTKLCGESRSTDIDDLWKLLFNIRSVLLYRQQPPNINDPDNATYWVDIPNGPEESWMNVAVFDTWEEAVKYTRENFGADEKGRVGLITMGCEDADE